MPYLIGLVVVIVALYWIFHWIIMYHVLLMIISIVGLMIGALLWYYKKNQVLTVISFSLLLLTYIVTNFANWIHTSNNSGGKITTVSAKPAVSDSTPSSNFMTTDQATAALADEKKKNQDATLTFEKQINDMENQSDSDNKAVQSGFKELAQGKIDVTSLYELVTKAKKSCDDVHFNMDTKLHVPDGLPADVSSLLSDARTEISTAYFVDSEAYGYAQQYLDEQKPSYLQKYNDSIKMANLSVASGFSKILQAKSKLGIDITDNTEKH